MPPFLVCLFVLQDAFVIGLKCVDQFVFILISSSFDVTLILLRYFAIICSANG